MILNVAFSNSNLAPITYQLLVPHGLDKTDLIVKWYDPEGFEQNLNGILQVVDSNNLIVNCNDVIAAGDHRLQIYYEQTLTGSSKRLFELGAETSILDTMRFALGKALTPAINVTWGTLKTLLYNALPFAKTSNNLSDMNASACRTTLGVYSTVAVDNELHLKTDAYEAPGAGVDAKALSTINTLKFLPSAAYHPATFASVTNMGFKMIYAGSVSTGGVLTTIEKNTDVLTGALSGTKPSTGIYEISHTLNSTSYFVVPISKTTGSPDIINPGQVKIELNKVTFSMGNNSGYADSAFDFFMFQIPAYIAD